MWKKVMVFVMVLFFAKNAFAGEFGIGGSWPVKGHSDSGTYSVNNTEKDSYAINSYYDIETDWKIGKFGVDPGFSYYLIRWWKNDNVKYEETVVDSHILGFHLRPYFSLFENFRLFGLGGVGYEWAENSTDDYVVFFGGGGQYYFSDKFSLSLSAQEIYNNPGNDYRRYDMNFVLTANFKF